MTQQIWSARLHCKVLHTSARKIFPLWLRETTAASPCYSLSFHRDEWGHAALLQSNLLEEDHGKMPQLPVYPALAPDPAVLLFKAPWEPQSNSIAQNQAWISLFFSPPTPIRITNSQHFFFLSILYAGFSALLWHQERALSHLLTPADLHLALIYSLSQWDKTVCAVFGIFHFTPDKNDSRKSTSVVKDIADWAWAAHKATAHGSLRKRNLEEEKDQAPYGVHRQHPPSSHTAHEGDHLLQSTCLHIPRHTWNIYHRLFCDAFLCSHYRFHLIFKLFHPLATPANIPPH